jgi:hypothetical protein
VFEITGKYETSQATVAKVRRLIRELLHARYQRLVRLMQP